MDVSSTSNTDLQGGKRNDSGISSIVLSNEDLSEQIVKHRSNYNRFSEKSTKKSDILNMNYF